VSGARERCWGRERKTRRDEETHERLLERRADLPMPHPGTNVVNPVF
jgi:hypothetical protein